MFTIQVFFFTTKWQSNFSTFLIDDKHESSGSHEMRQILIHLWSEAKFELKICISENAFSANELTNGGENQITLDHLCGSCVGL